MRRAGPWLVLATGVLLLASGVAVFWAANTGPADFGWTAYAPLQPGDPAPFTGLLLGGAVLWTTQHLVGVGLAGAGLLVLTGLGGWALGRRDRRAPGNR